MQRRYRYVEADELQDVQDQNLLRAGPNSCGDGKWVARHEEDAWEWGKWFDPELSGKVLALEVDIPLPHGVAAYEDHDGIGSAEYIEKEDLVYVRIVEVMEAPL